MPQTSTEDAVLRFYESFQPGNTHSLSEVLSADWVDHTLPANREPGVAGMQQALTVVHDLLPDLTTQIVKMISSGDTAAVHLVFTGTHNDPLFGAPPNPRPVRFIAFDMHRVSGDRIVESWHLEDNLDLFTQIGLIPRIS